MMKLSHALAERIKQKDTMIIAQPWTEEQYERMLRLSVELADWLTQRTEEPVEAYELLKIVLDALAIKFRIAGVVTVGADDEKKLA
jgi:hypothetical protein